MPQNRCLLLEPADQPITQGRTTQLHKWEVAISQTTEVGDTPASLPQPEPRSASYRVSISKVGDSGHLHL